MKNKSQIHRSPSGRSSQWLGLCTITFCILSAGQAMAQSTWTGADATGPIAPNTWNNSDNWSAIPVDAGALIFSGSPVNQPTNNDFSALIVGGISFLNAGPQGTAPNNVSTPFTLNGSAFTLGGGITNSVVGQPNVVGNTAIDINDTIFLNLNLSGTRTITTNTAGGTGGNRVSHNLIISGQISDQGAGHGLTKAGGATLSLSHVNNPFSGALTINGGVVNASVLEVNGSASSIGTGSVINFNGGALKFDGSTALSGSFNRAINLTSTATAGGTIENNSGSVALTINGVVSSADSTGTKVLGIGGSNALANVLASNLVNHNGGGALGLTKVGIGTWTLTGNNTHTGLTDINQGTLFVATIADSGTSNLGPGTEFRLGTGGQLGNLNYTGTGTTTLRRVRTGGTVATAAGVGAIQASATNGTSTGLKFTAPSFNVQTDATAARTLTLGGPNTDANEISGVITNHGTGVGTGVLSITKADAGSWILSGTIGDNTYTGVNTVTGGTLQVNRASNGLGNSTAVNAINLNGGTLSLRNDGAGNNGSITYGSTSNSAGYPVQLTVSNSTINVANLSANTGNTIQLGPLTQATSQARILNVTGSNGYSLTLASLGLNISNGQSTTLNPTTASLIITGNVTNPMASWTGGTANFDTLVLDGTSSGNRIQGVISDSATGTPATGGLTRITKNNSSTWVLNGANTNDGIVSVNDGMLLFNGDCSGAIGTISVSGGTLGGIGILGGQVNVNAGGSLAPGNAGVGTLAINSGLNVIAQASGTGKLNFELNTIAASDKIAVTGGLLIGTDVLGFNDFTFSSLAVLTNGAYPLITGATSFAGSLDPANRSGLLSGGKQGELQLSGNDIVLVVSDVVVSDPYVAWAGAGVNFDDDANNDGVDNGLAWLLGAADKDANANGLLPKSEKVAGGLKLTFKMLPAAERDGARFYLEYSADLASWSLGELVPDAGEFVAPVTFVISGTDPLDVEATVSSTEAPAGKLFGRLRAER